MSLETTITGANLDAAGNLKVALSNTPAYVGAARMLSENDSGSKLGVPYLRAPRTSVNYRLRVGMDTMLFNDTFNATAQNISLWKHAFTTMTMTMSAGFLNVNAAGTSTVSGNFAWLQTWRHFSILGMAPLVVETTSSIDRLPIANEVYHFGLGIAVNAAEPADGAWFELTSAGLKGVLRYNSGTAIKVDLDTAANIPLNDVRKYAMITSEEIIEFWVDEVLYGTLAIPAAQGQPFITSSLPYFIQKYNNGVVGSSPNLSPKIGDITITLMDINASMTWANQMASIGLGLQQLNGGSAGSPQIQWANTTLPTAAAATNTTAALGAFLGGLFQMNAPATSATDVIVASYQNPAGSANQTPRTMKLRGIKIDCVNQVVAVATTASVFAVAVAWGGSSATLAATESTSFQTATTKLRRVQPIGVIAFPVAAAVGAQATPLQFDFEAPLVINPGEFIQVIVKIILGTATATETFLWVVSPNLYHE